MEEQTTDLPPMERYVATDLPEIMVPSPIGAWVRWDDARAAVLAERGRCASVCDRMLYEEEQDLPNDWTAPMGWDWACQKIRDAIRKATP